jgi:hypothetical protein
MFGGQGIGVFMFGVGDPFNPGFLHWCKGNDPDAASDSGTLEITSPAEKLMNGCTWDSRNFVFSADRLFAVTPNFSGQGNQWIAQEVVSGMGLFSRWGFCVTPYGIAWIGKDGIYLWAGGVPKNITNETLFPLFPHAGVDVGPVNGYYPPDFLRPELIRLSFAANSLYFTYADTQANLECMRFDFNTGGWFPESYLRPPLILHQEDDTNLPALVGTVSGAVEELTAPGIDDGQKISCRVKTSFTDMGDSRALKYFQDAMLDYQIERLIPIIWYDVGQDHTICPVMGSLTRVQETIPLALNDGDALKLYTDIAVELFWDGPGTLWEFQPNAISGSGSGSGLISTTGLVTQYTDHGIVGYSHEKEAWASLISTGEVTLQIYVDAILHEYAIPSTAGKFLRVRVPLGPLKGKQWLYKITAPAEFIPFPDQIEILVKPWGSDAAFAPIRPFVGVAA